MPISVLKGNGHLLFEVLARQELFKKVWDVVLFMILLRFSIGRVLGGRWCEACRR